AAPPRTTGEPVILLRWSFTFELSEARHGRSQAQRHSRSVWRPADRCVTAAHLPSRRVSRWRTHPQRGECPKITHKDRVGYRSAFPRSRRHGDLSAGTALLVWHPSVGSLMEQAGAGGDLSHHGAGSGRHRGVTPSGPRPAAR